jgi:hypothetical protein
MPWWLLGVSMVACTFSADTPNLVTDRNAHGLCVFKTMAPFKSHDRS